MDTAEKMGMVLLFGELFSDDPEKKGRAIATLLTGGFDQIALELNKDIPEATVLGNLDRLKERHRRDLQRYIEREELLRLDRIRQTAVQGVKELNSPHTAGTVKEIAERLGISVKQVRKMKREGTLDEALAAAV